MWVRDCSLTWIHEDFLLENDLSSGKDQKGRVPNIQSKAAPFLLLRGFIGNNFDCPTASELRSFERSF